MTMARQFLDVLGNACVAPFAGHSRRKKGDPRPKHSASSLRGFEQLEQRALLSATILSEGFERGFPAYNGWSVGDANPLSAPTYWNDVSRAFGGDGVHSGLYKGYCAGTGNAGNFAMPSYRNNMEAYMSKSIDLSELSSATLSFWYKMPSIQRWWDHLQVYIDSTKIFDTAFGATAWTKRTIDLTSFVGGTHTLKFVFCSNRTVVAEGAYLDDILVTGEQVGPANNRFADRATISGMTAAATGTNVDATKATGEPDHAGNSGGKSVWWTWTAPYSCSVQLDTIGSTFDTTLGVYTGNSVSSLTAVAGDDNSGGDGTSKVTFNAVSGTSYRIAVDGFGGASGSIALQLNASLDDQYESDNTADLATVIGVNGSIQTHTIGTAADVDWMTFTLTETAPVVIETRGVSGGDTRMWLYGPDSTTTQLAYDDNGGIGSYSRIVSAGLESGTYHLKVDDNGNNSIIPQYTLSVTALELADVFLTRDDADLLSKAICLAEAKALGVSYSSTYSHSATYLGSAGVAEMVARGYQEVGLVSWFSTHEYVDIYRNANLGDLGASVVAATRTYAGTPYAYFQIEVLGVTALYPQGSIPIITAQAWSSYRLHDAGTKRMICSELVSRAFADVGGSATLDVTLWPSMAPKDTSLDFHWDFTTPTMLSLSPDLTRLNA